FLIHLLGCRVVTSLRLRRWFHCFHVVQFARFFPGLKGNTRSLERRRRKIEVEAGALAFFRLQREEAVAFVFQQLLNGGKAQTCSLADGFGCEKRLPELVQVLRGNPGSCVGDADLQKAAVVLAAAWFDSPFQLYVL